MKVRVILKALDMQRGEEKILADGPALLNGNTLLYHEKGSGIKHRITFDDQLSIDRYGEAATHMHLHPNGSETIVESVYGDMNLDVQCLYIKKEKSRWEAEYILFSGNEQIMHQKLEWTISEFS